ncbi:MAG: transporter substrate-binding domain-containing protein [Rhodospirillaceae bacterium]|nr:transporter substrate-binding domain-containing protein [Rhodospirillaceae bacterium]
MYEMRSRKISGWSLCLAVAVVLAGCGGDDSGPAGTTGQDGDGRDLFDLVMERGTLRVALQTMYRPGSFLDSRGKIVGFNPDVIEEVARRLGLGGVEYVEPSFEIIVAGNWQGRWDVAVHGITITAERQAVLLFTQPYVHAGSYIAIHEDNTTITDSEADLDGKKIGTCSGCAQQRYLEHDLVLPNMEVKFYIQDADIRPYQSGTVAAIEDLSLGDGVRLDAVLDEISSICEHRERGRPVKLVPDRMLIFSEVSGLAFDANARPDATRLRDEIDRIIDEMHADETLADISGRWYDGWDRSKPGGMPMACGD